MGKANTHAGSRWKEFILGWLVLLVPIAGIAWWIYVTQSTPGEHADMVARYKEVFPPFLRGRTTTTWIQLGFAGMACLLFFKGLDQKGLALFANLTMLCIGGLLAFWLLFSLM